MKLTLTNTAIKGLDAGATLWDTMVPGLHVRALDSGKAYYLFFRTKDGISRRPKIGDVTVVDLARAREIARSLLADVAAGKDPIQERTKARGAMTVDDLFRRVLKEHWRRKKSSREIERIYDAHIKSRLGSARVRNVDYQAVNGLHAALSATPIQANRALAALSKMLSLAERYGERVLGSNPCKLVSRNAELRRARFAKPHELQEIGKALDTVWADEPASAAFIALLIYTGMRKGEVARAKRKWIERLPDGNGVLHLPDSKTGQRDVYLSKHAIALIDKLPEPKDGTLTGILDPKKTWAKVSKKAGCPDLRMHDLRRTFASVSLAGGASISLIGELLGHKTAQTTKIYARLMDDAAHKVADSTGDRMTLLLTSAPSSAST